MVLKPLNNDDIEASGSDKWGFFEPFYQGLSVLSKNNNVYIYVSIKFSFSSLLNNFLTIIRFQAKIY